MESIEKFRLITFPLDYPLGSIVSKVNKGMLILNPDFQRAYLWDNVSASRLIESFMLDMPIPVVYLSETKELDAQYVIVDGVQRITSIYRFFMNEYPLQDLSFPFMKQYHGAFFKDLPRDAQRTLSDSCILRCNVIRRENPEWVKLEVFRRLNINTPTNFSNLIEE